MMRLALFLSLLLCVLLQSCHGSVSKNSVFAARRQVDRVIGNTRPFWLRNRVRQASRQLIWSIWRNRQCKVSICFPLEGSSFVSNQAYDLQELYASLLSAIISTDTDAQFSAVQYSRLTTSILPSTSNIWRTINSIRSSRRNGDSSANLSAGLGYCGSQIRRGSFSSRAVVTLGSGRSTVGFSPSFIARVIKRSPTNGVIVPVLSSGSPRDYVSNLGASRNEIISLRSLRDFENALRGTVSKVCGF